MTWVVTNSSGAEIARADSLTKGLLTTWQNAAGRLWREEHGGGLRQLTDDEYARADDHLHGRPTTRRRSA